MAEMLSKHSKVTIHEIGDGMFVEANRVYLKPERKNITIQKGILYLSDSQTIQPNTAIDIFLDSLATDQKNKSIAIILSGTGTVRRNSRTSFIVLSLTPVLFLH
jgi:two-component system CheB/CheR fusion protein